MTSDATQDRFLTNVARQGSGNFYKHLELTRDECFIEGRQDIFDLLARKSHVHESWQHRLERLEAVSITDPLTGLLNAKGLHKALTRELARTERGLSSGGLLVIFNLENLKTIHEDHGTDAANRAASLIAKALEAEIRDMDLVARMSEDEFALLLTDTSMSDALERLQNMALRLNRLSLIWNGAEIRLNLSLGLKSYAKGSKAENLVQAANTDLQRNRHTGAAHKTGL